METKSKGVALYSKTDMYVSFVMSNFYGFYFKDFRPIFLIPEEEDIFPFVRLHSPRVVVIDYVSSTHALFKQMKRCSESFPETRFMITNFNHSDFEKNTLATYDVAAIFHPSAISLDIFRAINRLRNENYLFTKFFTESFLLKAKLQEVNKKNELTPLEINCIRHFISGYTEGEIAKKLCKKPGSVYNIFSHLHDKTGCRTYPQFITFASLHHILPLETIVSPELSLIIRSG